MSSYEEISNFRVKPGTMSPTFVVKFFTDLATSNAAKWIQARADIVKTSTPPASGKGRGKGGTALKKLLHYTFGTTVCRTGSACLRYVFEWYIRHTKGDPVEFALPVMIAINSLPPLLYPDKSQAGSYKTQVSLYSSIIQRRLTQDFAKQHSLVLQFAGGSDKLADRLAFKSRAQEEAALQRAHNLTHLVPVPEPDIVKAIWICANSDEPVDMHLLAQLMTFSRKSEILNPNVSRYCDYAKTGYIHQFGTAKERGAKGAQEPELELSCDEEEEKDEEREDKFDECGERIPKTFFDRRQVVKPILQIPVVSDDFKAVKGVMSVEDVLKVVKRLRDVLRVKSQLADGLTDKKVAKLLDDELPDRIKELFPTSAAFVAKDKHRPNNLNSHFLRKVGLNYAYLQQTSEKTTRFAGFAAQYGGWSTASGLDTSNSYADVFIERLQPISLRSKIQP
jgi:hypothetical protein